MLNINGKGMNTSLVVLTIVLAALTGCWDNLVFVSVDGSTDAQDGATFTDTADAPTDAPDVTDAPIITDVLDGGGTDVVVPPVDVADTMSPMDVTDVPATDIPDVTDGGTDAVVPPDVSCPTGLIRCGTTCVNTVTDNANCGRCGGVCTVGACVDGRCRMSRSAVRSFGFVNEDSATWRTIRDRLDATPITVLPFVGSYGYIDGSSRRAYHCSRVAMSFGVLPVPATQVRRAYLSLTRAGDRDDPPQVINVVRAPCGPWTVLDNDRTRWGSSSFGSEPASAFVVDVPHELPDTTRVVGGLLLRNAGGEPLFPSSGETCLGLRTADDLVDLDATPAFSPLSRSVAGPQTSLRIYSTTASLVVEYAP